MMKKLLSLLAVATSAAFPLFADDDYAVTEATSSAQTFALYTSAETVPTFALASGALSSPFNITYREGETVSVTSPEGVTTALSGADGTIEYTPTSGGVWTFSNSNGETAHVGVGWGVHGDGFTPETGSVSGVVLHTVGEGPDRRLKRSEAPPVAYSGDDWAGDLTKAAAVRFDPPADSGLEATTWNDISGGNGARAFTFSKPGVWTVTLTFADTTTETATITIVKGGFMLMFR